MYVVKNVNAENAGFLAKIRFDTVENEPSGSVHLMMLVLLVNL